MVYLVTSGYYLTVFVELIMRLRTSPQCSIGMKLKCKRKLSRHLSWDENSWKFPTTTFEEEDSITCSTSSKSVSSPDSVFTANGSKQFYFNGSELGGSLMTSHNSTNSISSGYIAEHEDSPSDPNYRSPSASDILLDNSEMKELSRSKRHEEYLSRIHHRVLTWDINPNDEKSSQHNSLNSNESDLQYKNYTSESDFSESTSGHHDLILPEVYTTDIPFAKHKFTKTRSDIDKKSFITSSRGLSLNSDVTSRLSDSFSEIQRQKPISLPNIHSTVSSSPITHHITRQDNVNFGMYNPLITQMTSPADGMLMNLGFGSSGSMLPQRFINSWYEKVAKAQLEKQQSLMAEYSKQSFPTEIKSHSTQNWTTVEVPQPVKPDVNIENPSFVSLPHHHCSIQTVNKQKLKETRMARLREYIESHAGLLQIGMDLTLYGKRKQFAKLKQSSLPISLETLNEDDEASVQSNEDSLFKTFSMKQKVSDSLTSCSITESENELNVTSSSDNNEDWKICRSQSPGPDHILQQQKQDEDEGHNKRHYSAINYGDSTCSNDSIEVANFMKPTTIEPAMVSIFLHDVDGNIQKTSPTSCDPSDLSFLHIPLSRSSSSSISPMPPSPVTVIEVGLDNQLDSLDTEDGLEEHTKVNCYFDGSKESVLQESSTVSIQDTGTGTDDGMVSPIQLLELSAISTEDTTSTTVQADDGSLSPLEIFTDYEALLEVIKNLGDIIYLSSDVGVQCDSPVEIEYSSQMAPQMKLTNVSNRSNTLLKVRSSDSDSFLSHSHSSSPSPTVSPKCLKSPPVHLQNSEYKFLEHKEFEEKNLSESRYNSPMLVVTNESGDQNNIYPDSDNSSQLYFKPIKNHNSICLEEDHYLIRRPRPRGSNKSKPHQSLHRRLPVSYGLTDVSNSDNSSQSDDSVYNIPKSKMTFKCDSIEQEYQRDSSLDVLTSESGNKKPWQLDCGIQTDNIENMTSQSSQTDENGRDIHVPAVCLSQTTSHEVQTEQNVIISRCVQTTGLNRPVEAFCQTAVMKLSRNIETQTGDSDIIINSDTIRNNMDTNCDQNYMSVAPYTITNNTHNFFNLRNRRNDTSIYSVGRRIPSTKWKSVKDLTNLFENKPS